MTGSSPSETVLQGSTIFGVAGPTRRSVPAVAATLASGAVMMIGGYLFHTHGWNLGGLVMIPAGPLISVAFAFASPPSNQAGRRSSKRAARVVLSLLMPSPGGGLTAARSLVVSVVSLVAGAVMAVAGYALAAWNPLLVPPLIAAGGAVIGLAFLVSAAGSPQVGTR